jgi:two-component system sensor histidine kinase YesM
MKFTASSAIVITMMVLLIEVSIYGVAIRQQMKDSGQIYSDLVDTMGKSFDDLYLSFKRGIDFITMNEELQQALEMPYESPDELEELNGRLKVLLSNRALFVNEIKGLYLYDSNQEIRTLWKKRSGQGEAYLPFPQIEQGWFLPSGKVSARVIKDDLVFTRTIRSMKDLKTIGYLLVVYDDKHLYQRIENVLPNKASSLLVFDKYGSVITHNYYEKDWLEEVIEKIPFSTRTKFQIIPLQNHKKVMISKYSSSSTGWQIISLVDVDYIIRSSVFLRDLVWILGIAAILGGVVIQWGLARRIVKPLNHMVEVVECAEKGDYTKRMELQTQDELKILGEAFNHMLEKTDVLVNQVLRDEIKFKEAQLALMQAQINPHMLYNTLECINWLAEFDRKEEIRQVTIAFSNLMKSMSSGKKMVTIREEIAYVEDFLSIYRIILEGNMKYQIKVADELNEIEIPRLLIQPLVENAVVHGIRKSLQGGQIHINIGLCEGGYLISVLDNGVGMTEEQVENIRNFAAGNRELKIPIGLGLSNVIERLGLVYGERAEFHIASEIDWGTAMDILIKTELKEGE